MIATRGTRARLKFPNRSGAARRVPHRSVAIQIRGDAAVVGTVRNANSAHSSTSTQSLKNSCAILGM
jgi:hypothetical protein